MSGKEKPAVVVSPVGRSSVGGWCKYSSYNTNNIIKEEASSSSSSDDTAVDVTGVSYKCSERLKLF